MERFSRKLQANGPVPNSHGVGTALAGGGTAEDPRKCSVEGEDVWVSVSQKICETQYWQLE